MCFSQLHINNAREYQSKPLHGDQAQSHFSKGQFIYDTRNRSTSELWDITWALWIWTACVCAGSASPTNQPGQQSRSAERVSVLLWGAGGLCQKGLEKSFDLWLDLLL